MADVVDIPEFRAFYYTDDTPRQFYTLRRYEYESGSGEMHCYNIAPGIQLSFNDLNLSSCYQPLNVQKDFLEINYCLEGGHEVEMVGGGITFLGEKDLSISGLYHDKRVIVNSRIPFNKYKGITILLELETAQTTLDNEFSKWHIDLQKIRTTLCPEGRVLLIKSKQKIDHIFAEILSVENQIRLPYYWLKILEILLLLSQLDNSYVEPPQQFTEKVSRRTQQVYQYIIENPFTQKNISEIAEIGCDIEFKDVYFSYNEEPVLTGVSFVAKQGEITALVGPSGSGKSTVSKLAARFWDADSGLITLGGIDVKTVEPEVLLKNYAIVFQNVTLFDESVMENIRLGRSGASDEDVRAAAKAAQCDEFIDRLPQGYDTNIGENGSKLSGGERQRISIARALLKNAPVILLDEATASMDAESETMVQTALSALLKGRTVIVIAHRMRTIANADKIVVLDKGKVTEVGTPSELAKKGGLYAHLVALQQKQQMSSLPT
ncbi:ABC transporter ATP-binding protein [Intestinimonas butyriciproducens]|uniref:ABC transporter ATP-binding protein n=1 Tax=Intestinimonas butyriciproducens TaxID=1297617 RepID=UPI003FA3D2A4